MDDTWGWAIGGVFTTRMALGHGIDRDVLTAGCRRGVIRSLGRGLYGVGPAAASPEARHAELCRALLLEYPDAVLAGRSALLASGLPVWGMPLSTALLRRPVDRQVTRSGARIRALDPGATVIDTQTGPATSPVHAIVQAALDHGAAAGVVTADAALNRGVVAHDTLVAETSRRAGHRRVQQAVAMTSLSDGRSESVGESRLRLVLVAAGLAVTPQVQVRDAGGALVGRVDLAVEGTNVLVEFDGLVKYRDGGPEALVREKRREDRLRALGYIVVRITWQDLRHPDRVVAAVRRAVAISRRHAA